MNTMKTYLLLSIVPAILCASICSAQPYYESPKPIVVGVGSVQQPEGSQIATYICGDYDTIPGVVDSYRVSKYGRIEDLDAQTQTFFYCRPQGGPFWCYGGVAPVVNGGSVNQDSWPFTCTPFEVCCPAE